jgi:ABC-type nitrate/sulfonate/bicarbonate transport system substrate-binding protein
VPAVSAQPCWWRLLIPIASGQRPSSRKSGLPFPASSSPATTIRGQRAASPDTGQASGAAATGTAADAPKEIRLDYAYYSPPSLVLKRFGWLEQEFKAENIPIKWVLSQGSNRALEFLNSGSIDFGSTAGLAAVLSKANGNPIKGVYIYSRPEWTALVVAKDSPIKSIKDLKGKKVAATKGTDPFLFLLRSLHLEGLKKSDIEHARAAARRRPRRS